MRDILAPRLVAGLARTSWPSTRLVVRQARHADSSDTMIQHGALRIGIRARAIGAIATSRQQHHLQTRSLSAAVKKIAAIVMGAPGRLCCSCSFVPVGLFVQSRVLSPVPVYFNSHVYACIFLYVGRWINYEARLFRRRVSSAGSLCPPCPASTPIPSQL